VKHMASASGSETQAHQAVVREQFTRQTAAYAAAPVITDADRIARLIGDYLRRDLSGMRPFSDAAGLRFIQRIAALACRKL